jgi:hypothetical protein
MAPERAHAAARALTLISGAAAAVVLWQVFDAPFGAIWIALIAVLGMRAGREAPSPSAPVRETEVQEPGADAERQQEEPPAFPI